MICNPVACSCMFTHGDVHFIVMCAAYYVNTRVGVTASSYPNGLFLISSTFVRSVRVRLTVLSGTSALNSAFLHNVATVLGIPIGW